MNSRLVILISLALAIMGSAFVALKFGTARHTELSPISQPSKPQPSKQPPAKKQPAKAPAKPAEVKKDPKQVLADVRAALKNARAISYTALVTAEGANAEKAATYTGDVVLSRADAGGWKLYTKGKVTGAGESETPFEIGFDGVTVRSIRESDRVMFEKTILEWEDLEAFLGTQSAKPLIAWEALAESPFEKADERAVFEGQQDVGGELCDVIFVPDAAPGAAPVAAPPPADKSKPQPRTQPKPQAKTPGVKAEEPATAIATGVRYAFSATDLLPRRVERIQASGAEGEAGVRVLTMREFKTNEHAAGAAFVLAKPDGFRIRDPDLARARERKKDPGQILGDPEKKREQSNAALNPGDVAPAWDLKDHTGKSVSLASLKGKVVVMDFWGTWCGWCVKAMPAIEKVHQKYKDQDVVVLGMNVENDKRADPAGFMRRNKYTYGLILNSEKITKDYKVAGYPTLIIVDQEGKIAAVETGFSPELESTLSARIDALLKK